MALKELLGALEQDAEARITAVRAAAKATADQLRADAGARLERRRTVDLAVREAESRAAAAEVIESVRREATRRGLLARAEALDRILTRARDLLATLEPDATLLAGIRREIDAAFEYVGSSAGVVRCSPAWVSTLKKALAGRSGVRLEANNAIGAGMVVLAADGRVEIHATLHHRLDQLWPELAIELVRQLEAPQ